MAAENTQYTQGPAFLYNYYCIFLHYVSMFAVKHTRNSYYITTSLCILSLLCINLVLVYVLSSIIMLPLYYYLFVLFVQTIFICNNNIHNNSLFSFFKSMKPYLRCTFINFTTESEKFSMKYWNQEIITDIQ